MSARIRRWVVLGVLVLCGALRAEEPQTKTGDDAKDDWRSRPIYLLKVTPQGAGKIKVTDGKLLSKRIYARSEPRLFKIDEVTGVKTVTGGWGVDFTNTESKFLDEPRRLIRVGTVVPGSFLGDTDERNYEYTAGEGTFAERMKPVNPAKKRVGYKMLNFYKDGTCTEVMFGPDSELVR